MSPTNPACAAARQALARRAGQTLVLGAMFSAALVLGACSSDSHALEPFEDADTGADAAEDLGVPSQDTGGEDTLCVLDPHADSDGDGLLDIIEDRNRNCIVDEGETDPHNPDTDGDGLPDGWEDVDLNGVWDADRGEFNPRVADTNGDGIPDSESPLAAVCTSALLTRSSLGWDALEERRYVLPSGTPAASLERSSTGVTARSEAGSLYLGHIPLEPTPAHDVYAPTVYVAGTRLVAMAALETGWQARYALEASATRGSSTGRSAEEGLSSSSWLSMGSVLSDGVDAIQVDVAADEHGQDVAIATSRLEHDAREGWLAGARVQPASGSSARLRAMCEAQVMTSSPPEALTIVLMLNTSPAGLESAGVAVEAVAGVLRERANLGLETQVVLGRADAHVEGAAGSFVSRHPLRSPAELRRTFASMEAGKSEQRVWLNGAALLKRLRADDVSGAPVALVAVSPTEDVEFREGVSLGYDGHPLGAPLAASDRRRALSTYYGGLFQPIGVQVVALRSGSCEERMVEPNSLADVSMTSGGVYLDLCDPLGAALLHEVVEHRLGVSSTVHLGRMLASSEASVVGEDSLAPRPFGAESNVAAVGRGDLDAGAAYLYWEAPEEPSNRP